MSFETLPAEIQEAILEQASQPSTRRVSRGFYTISGRPYLEQVCSIPISRDEIVRYLDQLPQKFGLFNNIYEHYVFNIYESIKASGEYQNYIASLEYTMEEDEVYHEAEDEAEDEEEGYTDVEVISINLIYSRFTNAGQLYLNEFYMRNNLKDQTQVDLVSLFNILAARLGCINADPNYARDAVKTYFNNFINVYNPDNIHNLLFFYLYLSGNAKVMGLLVKDYSIDIGLQKPKQAPEIWDLEFFRTLRPILNKNEKIVTTQIRQHVDELIVEIRNYLDNMLI